MAKQVQELTKLNQSVLDLEARYTALRNSYESEIRNLQGELDRSKRSKVSESSDGFASKSHGRGHDVRRRKGRCLIITQEPLVGRGGERHVAPDLEHGGDGDIVMASPPNPADGHEVLDLSTPPPFGQPPTSELLSSRCFLHGHGGSGFDADVVDGRSSRGSNPVQGRDGKGDGELNRDSKQDREQDLPVSLPAPRSVTSPVSIPQMPLSHPTGDSSKGDAALPSACASLTHSYSAPHRHRRSGSLGPALGKAPEHKDTNSFTSEYRTMMLPFRSP